MKKLLTILLLGSLLFADSFEEAMKAYKEGKSIEAFQKFKPLAKNGDKEAQFNLATMYLLSEGIKGDVNEARMWYEKSALNGCKESAYNVALLYEEEVKKGKKEGYVKAKAWYEKAIALGEHRSYNNLALLYLKGYGVKRDTNEALQLLLKGAQAGDSVASLNVARLLAWEEGVTHDKLQAYTYLKRALKAGESEASGLLDRLCQESAWACKN